jgi:hypothetical protein
MKIKTGYLIIFLFVTSGSCGKEKISEPATEEPGPPLKPAVDPAIMNTVGFFMDDWQQKSFIAPAYTETALTKDPVTVSITIDAASIITKVPGPVFGQNANSWMTQMVTEQPLMAHLKRLRPALIRFPGGSISDLYFWNRSQNQKPADAPDSLPDADGKETTAGYWYGKNNDNWTISLDNYYALLQQTGSGGMITVNYGYARYGKSQDPVAAAAHLAADWVRYDNGRTKYWEIGNECNGVWEAGYRIDTRFNRDQQPAIINGALYGRHIKVFIDSMKKAAAGIGKTIYIGAYMLEKKPEAWQTATDQAWNTGLLAESSNRADFYAIHSYYTPYQTNASAIDILNSAVTNTSALVSYVKSELARTGAEVKPVALTEWNITSQGSMQQVSTINGMHAAIVLAESIKNHYGQTSRWDLANGWANGNDHGLFNIGDEPGGISKWNPRPAFYYIYFLQKMMGDRMLKTTVAGDLLAYGSSFSSGAKAVIIVNKGTGKQVAGISIQNTGTLKRVYWYSLTGGADNGDFSRKLFVNGIGPEEATGGPSTVYESIKANSSSLSNNEFKIPLAGREVVYLVVE